MISTIAIPQEMRVPVYNRSWQNYYPKSRRYHQGHHFSTPRISDGGEYLKVKLPDPTDAGT
jgi:hypothetical protein